MTPTEARDLTADLFTWRQAQTLPGDPGAWIESVDRVGEAGLMVTFTDGTYALLTVTTHDSPRGNAS